MLGVDDQLLEMVIPPKDSAKFKFKLILGTHRMDQRNDSMTLATKRCPLCTFEARAIPVVLSHLRVVHSSDPRFNVACGINGCASTSKSFPALYSHIYRHHPDIIKNWKREVVATEELSLHIDMPYNENDGDSQSRTDDLMGKS